jgi:hypothetical protein
MARVIPPSPGEAQVPTRVWACTIPAGAPKQLERSAALRRRPRGGHA